MTGAIRLYNKHGKRIRSEFYYNKENRKKIIDRWRDLYGFEFEEWHYQIVPYVKPSEIEDAQIINIDINTEPEVINTPSPVIPVVKKRTTEDINMSDYVGDGIFKRESWYHKTYCRGEK